MRILPPALQFCACMPPRACGCIARQRMLAHAHACSADCKGRPRQNLPGGFGRQVRKGTRDDNTAEYPRALQSTTEYPGAQCGTHHGNGPNRALPKLRVSAVWYCVKVANESLPARPAPFGVIDARAQHASGVVAGFHAAAADRCVEACGQLGGPALRGRVVSCQGRCRQFQFQFQRTRLVPVRM